VTNHFVALIVYRSMGWSPQIETRLRDVRMMIPEIRAVIGHAEVSVRNQLRLLLAAEAGVELVEECSNAAQTVAAVRAHKPDLLLLDMGIQDGRGVQVLDRISQDEMPIVIFTSANDQHAIRAFEARAFDFLLIPVDHRRVHAAIERTRAELLRAHDRHLTHRILDLLAEAKTESRTDRRLVIKTAGRVVLLDMDDVDWIEAAGNYVELRIGSTSHLLREGISKISQRLDPKMFVRIHRSIIVNVRRIKELQPCNRGEYIVVLKDGKQLSCSRGYRGKLQELIASS
jgi:two-component system, LytTR family, response regulator